MTRRKACLNWKCGSLRFAKELEPQYPISVSGTLYDFLPWSRDPRLGKMIRLSQPLTATET